MGLACHSREKQVIIDNSRNTLSNRKTLNACMMQCSVRQLNCNMYSILPCTNVLDTLQSFFGHLTYMSNLSGDQFLQIYRILLMD